MVPRKYPAPMPAARAAAATAMMPASTTASFTRHPAGGTRPVQAAWTAGARGSPLPHDPETPAAPSGARRCREPAIHDSEVARSETIDLKAEGASFAFGYGGPTAGRLARFTEIAVQARQSRAVPRVGRPACPVKEGQVSTGMKGERRSERTPCSISSSKEVGENRADDLGRIPPALQIAC